MGLTQADREFMALSFSGTLDTELDRRVFLIRATATASPLGGPITIWATATSFFCNIQPIEAFRKIQEGIMVGPGGLNLVSTHRGFIEQIQPIFEGDRIEQQSGSATEYFEIRNVREYSGSHTELDMLRVRPNT